MIMLYYEGRQNAIAHFAVKNRLKGKKEGTMHVHGIEIQETHVQYIMRLQKYIYRGDDEREKAIQAIQTMDPSHIEYMVRQVTRNEQIAAREDEIAYLMEHGASRQEAINILFPDG